MVRAPRGAARAIGELDALALPQVLCDFRGPWPFTAANAQVGGCSGLTRRAGEVGRAVVVRLEAVVAAREHRAHCLGSYS